MAAEAVSLVVLVLAAIPAVVLAVNLWSFRRAPRVDVDEAAIGQDEAPARPKVSVLIPARDEEGGIAACVRGVLASRGVELEVIVLDDRSTDGTAALVRRIAQEDGRVRLEHAPPLPAGWCGKQHACHVLAMLARHNRLLWIDADTRLSPDAITRTCAFMDRSGAPLVSGFPQQVCVTWAEALVVPLMHLVLLGYLPVVAMRWCRWRAFAAGCGQLVMVERGVYREVGGHGAIRGSLHDGVMLPRRFRVAGHRTDLFDAGDVAWCRMYDSPRAVWEGFAKNATEGLATPVGIWVWSVLLLGGHVLPWLWGGWMLATGDEGVSMVAERMAVAALLLTVAVNAAVWWRFRQPWRSLLLRPVGVVVLMSIQWHAYLRRLTGEPVSWRGRRYVASGEIG